MSIERIKASIPEYAQDIKLNFGLLLNEPSLTPQQRGGVFIAAAVSCRNGPLLAAVMAEFAPVIGVEAVAAAKTAASLMAMNNIYYRFVYEIDGDYRNMPAKLRMNGLAQPDIDRADFELFSLAASAINGCAMCMQTHEETVRELGLSSDHVQAAVRIAATLHAVAVVLEAECAGDARRDSVALTGLV